jgi:NADH:ubiquinone oxidoreductase subunit 2 (subunit N)
MLVYVFSIIGIFMCLNQTTSLPQDKWSGSFERIYQTNKIMGAIIVGLLLSFSGVPPFAGFYAKYYIFLFTYVQFSAYLKYYILIALISSAVILVVYLQLVISTIRNSKKNIFSRIPIMTQSTSLWNIDNINSLTIVLIFSTIAGYDYFTTLKSLAVSKWFYLLTSILLCPNSHYIAYYGHYPDWITKFPLVYR